MNWNCRGDWFCRERRGREEESLVECIWERGRGRGCYCISISSTFSTSKQVRAFCVCMFLSLSLSTLGSFPLCCSICSSIWKSVKVSSERGLRPWSLTSNSALNFFVIWINGGLLVLLYWGYHYKFGKL